MKEWDDRERKLDDIDLARRERRLKRKHQVTETDYVGLVVYGVLGLAFVAEAIWPGTLSRDLSRHVILPLFPRVDGVLVARILYGLVGISGVGAVLLVRGLPDQLRRLVSIMRTMKLRLGRQLHGSGSRRFL